MNELNTYEDFKRFISEHPEISTRTQFKNLFPREYSKFLILKQRKIILQDFPIESKRKSYSLNVKYKSLKDFQDYINENGLHSSKEFQETNKPLYNRAMRLGIAKNLTYIGKLNYRTFDSIEKIQKYVDEHNIISRIDLKRDNASIYRRYLKFRTQDSDLVFPEPAVDSSYESMFLRKLNEERVLMFPQRFLRFSGGKAYRYDFINFEYKLIVEVHGRQHFDPSVAKEAWGSDYDIVQNDKNKKSAAESIGYTVLYFTYNLKEYNEFGYFDSVYTDENEIINKLRTIIPPKVDKESETRTIDSPIEEIEETYISPLEVTDISDLLQIIQQQRIKTPTELIDKFPKLYSKAERLKWVRNLYYYVEEGEVGDMKNYRCLEDVQSFLNNRGLTLIEFRKNHYKLYNKCWRRGWLSGLSFKEKNREDN